MAVLFVTHDLGVVSETCDRMITMYAGRIVERGPVAEVLAQPGHPYTAGLLAALPTQIPEVGGSRPFLVACHHQGRSSRVASSSPGAASRERNARGPRH